VPPVEPGAHRRPTFEAAGGAAIAAATGGASAILWIGALCELLAIGTFLITGTRDLVTWARLGLLTTVASVRASIDVRLPGLPGLRVPQRPVDVSVVFVPMLLTLGFVWLAARAGRRAAEQRSGRGVLVTSAVAAAGAAISAGALAALAAVPVSLSFPRAGLGVHVDVASASLGAGSLAAVAAAAGVFLHDARGRIPAAAVRGGLVASAWAIALLVFGAVVVSALEPDATRAYVDGLGRLGAGGGVLFGIHVMALPAQSALLLVPASGSCLQLVGDGPVLDLCPWRLVPSGPAAAFLSHAVTLSPWLWAMNGAPPIAAALGGVAAAREARSGRGVVVGALAGAVFALLAVGGAWFASPRIDGALPLLGGPGLAIGTDPVALGATCLLWGLAGGAVGGWLEGRR
jgi:hypothetical protein